jgi:hypothetical protein
LNADAHGNPDHLGVNATNCACVNDVVDTDQRAALIPPAIAAPARVRTSSI